MKAVLVHATIFFALISCGVLFAEKGVLIEKQAMELKTLDGTRILLYEDSTWQFKDPKHQEIEKDFTVPLGGPHRSHFQRPKVGVCRQGNRLRNRYSCVRFSRFKRPFGKHGPQHRHKRGPETGPSGSYGKNQDRAEKV